MDIVSKIWAILKKLFAPLGVPSWLRAWWPSLWNSSRALAFSNWKQSVERDQALKAATHWK